MRIQVNLDNKQILPIHVFIMLKVHIYEIIIVLRVQNYFNQIILKTL